MLQWMPWQDAAGMAGATAATWTATDRSPGLGPPPAPWARELTLTLVLYAMWQYAGAWSLGRVSSALARGRHIWDLERALHLPSERSAQQLVLHHASWSTGSTSTTSRSTSPRSASCLVWLFVRHRDRYPRVRNVVALVTGASLLIQMFPVAPPRLLPHIGVVDTGALVGPATTPAGRPGIDQLSAMPSLHVAWALIVGGAVVWVVPAPVSLAGPPVPRRHHGGGGGHRQPLLGRRHRRRRHLCPGCLPHAAGWCRRWASLPAGPDAGSTRTRADRGPAMFQPAHVPIGTLPTGLHINRARRPTGSRAPPRARNPFHYGTPAEGDHFTGRRDELAALLTRMRNGVNVVLLSPRRYGKTSLLRAAEARLTRGRPAAAIIDVNVLRATSLSGVVGLLTAGAFHLLGGPLAPGPPGRARVPAPGAGPSRRHLRPERQPPLRLRRRPDRPGRRGRPGRHLRPARRGGRNDRPAALVLDEFQAITRHGDHLPDLFKALADAHPRVSLVLAGSKRHLMEELVIHHQAPLFGMAQRLSLGPIPAAEMEAYLRQRAAGAGKPLDETGRRPPPGPGRPGPQRHPASGLRSLRSRRSTASTWPPSTGAWPGPSTTTACSSPKTWPASRPARAGS